jgi:hypothetical protein
VSNIDCGESSVLAASQAQTDQTLWYSLMSTRLNSMGPPPNTECATAVPFESYADSTGSGTVYACIPPLADDRIYDSELSLVELFAQRLNGMGTKTLADHMHALALKGLVRGMGG